MPEPGWYPDPSGQAAWRWWNGTEWTANASGPAGAATPSPFTKTPAQLVEQETKTARFAKIALIGYAVVTLLSIALTVPLLRGMADFLRTAIEHPEAYAEPGTCDPFMGLPPALIIASQALSPLQLAAWVTMLVWVHQAATAAKSLRIPARRSPAWAVGAWFVPVVNLWWPC